MATDARGQTTSIFDEIKNFIAKHQQTLKWTVYVLLLANFGYYLFDDWRAAQITLSESATLIEIMSSYATSLDELGWFTILFLLEFETYWMEDDDFGKAYWVVQIVRVACYGLIGHTLYAFGMIVADYSNVTLVNDMDNLCAFAGQDLSFLRNLLYEAITIDNCSTLSSEATFYKYPDEPVITDTSGLYQDLRHSWIDLLEVVGWLSISLLLTFVIIMQDRKIIDGPMIKWAHWGQYFVYAALTGMAIYWAYYEFYVYTWDILLWMGGFAAIDANLAEWREELKDEKGR